MTEMQHCTHHSGPAGESMSNAFIPKKHTVLPLSSACSTYCLEVRGSSVPRRVKVRVGRESTASQSTVAMPDLRSTVAPRALKMALIALWGRKRGVQIAGAKGGDGQI